MSNSVKCDFFTLFGLQQTYSQDNSDIKTRYLQLQRKMHPDNFVNATPQEKRLVADTAATINEAYRTLSVGLKRAIYLLKIRGVDVGETDTSMPMDFLSEQMELRERLASGEIHPLKEEVQVLLLSCEQQLSDNVDNETGLLTKAREVVRKMQFYSRLLEQIIAQEP